ncbi:MAG: FIG139438: lipoprotein B [uncultured Sulfurovum sp.]|uniref:FIG139438: lipoprotein B n=1 Tax=uncultured Sulfurovum sp. TaxID=269237 RepID=A0A6S6T327_9BACT|nr:MAG: FIG139438: lipoprotein B [uncultured Sulfurovum sp.]
MKIFSTLYAKAMGWARHPKAPYYLGGLSFAESSFFPIPPDVMLAPMSLAKPDKAWKYAFLTTITSVLGGILGYFIGVFAFDFIEPILHSRGYLDRFELAKSWFESWGFWAILLAGFSPIPYKVFTIASGVVGMAFLPFVIASLLGRGLRFFMVAGLMAWGGAPMEKKLHKYTDIIGWGLVVIFAIAWLILR